MLIAPIVVANTLSGISGDQYFTATNQIGILLISQVSAAIGNVLLNLLLVPKMGFYGSAVATVVTSYVCAAIQWYYLSKQVKLVGLGREVIKAFVSSTMMFVFIVILTKDSASTPKTTIIQFLIGVVAYFTLSVLLRDRTFYVLIDAGKKIIMSRLSK